MNQSSPRIMKKILKPKRWIHRAPERFFFFFSLFFLD
jgi:hypothetical protein